MSCNNEQNLVAKKATNNLCFAQGTYSRFYLGVGLACPS
jgi:hypothetical protein